MPKKQQEECEAGAPAWMVTYGDMMTLLLTFFVLIVSFSSIESVKFKAAISSIQEGLGMWPSNAGLLPTMVLFQTSPEQAKEAAEMVEDVAKALEESAIDQVEIYNTPAGIRLIISDPVLFRTGRAEIRTEFRDLLVSIADIIDRREYSEIRVEGHTDNVPIETDEFPSNWELSAIRALNVVKVLAFDGGLSPAKLSGVGYGEFRPRASNDTVEGRGLNRRVEIWIEYREEQSQNL